MKELEEIFTVDASIGTNSKSGKDTTKNPALTTLLDITRANNVGKSTLDCLQLPSSYRLSTAIMLARIKLSKSEIRQALLEVDDDRLSTDDLRSIARQLPTQEEINRIRDFGDLGTLSKSDQYFGEVSLFIYLFSEPGMILTIAQIMHISRLSERLECVIYRRRLDFELAEVKPDLNMVRNAGAEIKASKRLRRVLGVSDTHND
jgi:hypothetical protein